MSQQTIADTRRSWKGSALFLAICCIFGAVLGMLVFKPLIGQNEVIGVLAIGFVDVEDDLTPLEQVGALTTRMSATEFTKAVAERLSDPTAADQLLAPVYGGDGDLRARALRDANRVEIRVSNASEPIATERLNAVIDEVLMQHERLASDFLAFTFKQRDDYQRMLVDAETLYRQINQDISSGKSGSADYNGLLESKGKIIEQITMITRTLSQLNQLTKEPYFQRSKVLAGPSPLRPLLRSSWQTALLGAIAGFALGFIAIQIKRAIV